MLRLEVITRRPFDAALFDASTALGQSGGWISHHQLYSDAMAVFSFELPADRLEELVGRLAGLDLKVGDIQGAKRTGAELRGQLVMTFPDGGSDRRREVPAFG